MSQKQLWSLKTPLDGELLLGHFPVIESAAIAVPSPKSHNSLEYNNFKY